MHYFVKTLKGEKGPFSRQQLQELAQSGTLKPAHFIRRENGHGFSQAGRLLEELFTATPDASPKKVAQCNESVENPPPIAPDSSGTIPVYRSNDSLSDIDII